MKKFDKNYYKNVYLHSDEWNNKRAGIMRFYEHLCYDCGCTAQEVHHLTYDNIYQEKPQDLIPLCKNCHEVRHGISKKHKFKYDEIIVCHGCNYHFKSNIDFFEEPDLAICPNCFNNWSEYGFH
jgi:hypothetical protein